MFKTRTPSKAELERSSEASCAMEYTGYSSVSVEQLARIDCESLTPEEFFHRYISTRTPVVLTEQLSPSEWSGRKWSNEYLRNNAGNSQLEVLIYS